MKQNAGIEMFLVALLLGVAIGILYSRWLKIENQIVGYDSRIVVLEQEHAERMKVKARWKTILGFAARCLSKITFGLIKRP